MSGGSYEYAYLKVLDFVDTMKQWDRKHSALRQRFADHLEKVAEAMKAVEWTDSGDSSEESAEKAIKAVLAEAKNAEEVIAFSKSLRGVKVSPWVVIEGYCATRVIQGGNPFHVEDRVAFIEKSPRVLVDGEWLYGPKGAGGSGGDDPKNLLYGFYPPSRQWCDEQLLAAGAILPKE